MPAALLFINPNYPDGIANSVDPDQTAPYRVDPDQTALKEQSDLGLHCLLSLSVSLIRIFTVRPEKKYLCFRSSSEKKIGLENLFFFLFFFNKFHVTARFLLRLLSLTQLY